MSMALKEKADSMQNHKGNFTREVEIIRESHMKNFDT